MPCLLQIGYEMFEILFYLLLALLPVILVSQKLKMSKRYEIREMSDWRKLDKGFDPTKESE